MPALRGGEREEGEGKEEREGEKVSSPSSTATCSRVAGLDARDEDVADEARREPGVDEPLCENEEGEGQSRGPCARARERRGRTFASPNSVM